jgi:uncharacterized protein
MRYWGAKDLIGMALSGDAQYIISGDKDLLVLHPFRDVRVMTADEFLKTIEFGGAENF